MQGRQSVKNRHVHYTSSYWIDDGSGGIRVTDAQAIPVVGHYRAVTGIPWLSSPAGTAVLLEVSAQVVPE